MFHNNVLKWVIVKSADHILTQYSELLGVVLREALSPAVMKIAWGNMLFYLMRFLS